ncbi:hypothetical protein ACFQX6_49100 [Streptosporangium lutulentum]
MALAVVKDLRVARAPATTEDLEALEIDVPARAAAGLSDGTISSDVLHLEQARAWFGSAAVGDGARRRRCVLRQGAVLHREGYPAGAGSGGEDVLCVPGTTPQGQDSPDDRPRGRMPYLSPT